MQRILIGPGAAEQAARISCQLFLSEIPELIRSRRVRIDVADPSVRARRAWLREPGRFGGHRERAAVDSAEPIIALPSTAKGGKLTRIQAAFEAGAAVVTSRGDVRYVVNEYGVADLSGRNVRQRALSLIEIAHRDFRGDLLAAAKAIEQDQRRTVLPLELFKGLGDRWRRSRCYTLGFDHVGH